MYHPHLRSILSPLTPIPTMSQSAFSFSPTAINLCLEASKSTTPSVLKSRRSFTPDFLDISSPADISPIDFLPNNSVRKLVSPNCTIDSNSSLNKGDESFLFSLDDGIQSSWNISNINNRNLDINTVLEDLGLKEYQMIFEIEEIDLIAFILLTDDDLQELGVLDKNHRDILTGAIKKYYDCIKIE